MARGAVSRGACSWAVLVGLTLGVVGCRATPDAWAADESDESDDVVDDDRDDTAEIDLRNGVDLVPPAVGRVPGDAGDPPIEGTTTIYDIQRPSSPVPVGSVVTVDSQTIKVTAVGKDRFWMQEVGSSGLCDEIAEPVEYRGITVMPLGSFALAVGQRVRVTGTVAELAGNTTLIDAQVTTIGEPSEPYAAQCDRAGTASTSEALEGVLVLTSGSTEGYAPPGDGVWGLTPCFDEGGTVLVGSLLYERETWSASWHWVRGVVVQSEDERIVMPRDESDVMADMGDDVCL